MCFARSHGAVSYFKPLNPETNLAKLLLPSLACRVVDASLVTPLVMLIQDFPSNVIHMLKK